MRHLLADLVRTSLLIVGALFPIVNPLGNAPIFLALTRNFSSAIRSVLARKIAVNGFILLIVSLLIGTHILNFFGISLPVVEVGGGFVVIATAWKLLNRRDDDDSARTARAMHPSDISERAFYPLTLPLTVGPGSISVAIAVGANRPAGVPTGWPLLVAALIGAGAIAITIYLSYRFAEGIARVLGETAMHI